jgi:type IV pilus assembly protein PilB
MSTIASQPPIPPTPGQPQKPPAGTPSAQQSAGPAGPASKAPAASAVPSVGGMPPIDQLKGRQIGRVLTKMGKVTREQVVEALSFQKSKGGAIGRILIDLGYIKELDLNVALAAQRGIEIVNLEGRTIPPEAIEAVPAQIATTNKIIPLAFNKASRELTIAMSNQENFRALDDLQSLMGYKVKAVIADPEQIDKLIGKHYKAAAESFTDVLKDLNADDTLKIGRAHV